MRSFASFVSCKIAAAVVAAFESGYHCRGFAAMVVVVGTSMAFDDGVDAAVRTSFQCDGMATNCPFQPVWMQIFEMLSVVAVVVVEVNNVAHLLDSSSCSLGMIQHSPR